VQINENTCVSCRLQRKDRRNYSAVGKGGEDRASGRRRCVGANVDTIQKYIFLVKLMVLASSSKRIDVCVCENSDSLGASEKEGERGSKQSAAKF
jgi:hypothetical protein